MIKNIYYEQKVENHDRTQEFFSRFPQAAKISCNHFKEVFNPSGQNFRLQKKNPSLILASQDGKKVHPIPAKYGVGGNSNFYFSHLFNCLYDCRYCFLQGMFPSAHYVLFINYEEFWDDIRSKADEVSNSPSWFFSGYDCDSLALESTTGFVDFFLPKFSKLPHAFLELRTKSVNTRVLKNHEPLPNVIVAFSFTPEEISRQLEHGVPSVSARIKAMHQLATLGWYVGIRIDPVIDCQEFESRYALLFHQLFDKLPENSLHSVSLGAFRMPYGFFKKMDKLYPEENLFAGKLTKNKNSVSYEPGIETKRLDSCRSMLLEYIPAEKLFTCEMSQEK